MAGDEPQRLDLSVDEYLSESGWKTDHKAVNNGFYRIAAVSRESDERRVVLVCPSPETTVTEQEIDWLVEQAEDFGAGTAEITTNGTVTEEARRLADRHRITIQDPATYRPNGTGADQPRNQPAGGGPPPEQGAGQAGPPRQQTEQPPAGQGGQSPPPGQSAREPQQQSGPQYARDQQGSASYATQHGGQSPPPQQGAHQQRPQQRRRQPSQTDALSGVKDGFRPVGGFIYGAIGFVTAMIFVTIYFFYRADQITEGSAQVLPEEPQALGWAFYNANQVDIVFSAGGSTIQTINYLSDVDELNPLMFYALVGFMLFLAGYSVASRVAQSLSTEASAIAGASILVGYVPLLAAGSILFTIEESGGSAGPELGTTLLVWGVIYSVVFGGLGGLVADQI